MEKIAAGIVIFNPDDKKRLYASVNSVIDQVEMVYIFDNSTEKNDYDFSNRVIYMTEHKNNGLAYGMNRIMERAQSDGFDWVVTLDQDSIMPPDTISLYEKHAQNDLRIAIICPQAIDTRRSYMEAKKKTDTEYIDFCITSASCTRISAWEKVGYFDEWLFIDLVDNDFCKRIIVSGYKILCLNELVLDQEFGKIIPKSERVQNFWNRVAKSLHNNNFAKLGYIKFVNPMRVYYTNRNIIYVNRKLKQFGNTAYKENYNCNGYIGFLFCFMLPSILRAQERTKVFKYTIKGIQDGRRKKVKAWKP